ncbi:hypothetical protein BGZ98_003592, partial [Dissophora globulifera]
LSYNDLLPQQTRRALSVLSTTGAKNTKNPFSLFGNATRGSGTATSVAYNANASSELFGKHDPDNPFLDQPPQKLFKSTHNNNTESLTSTRHSNRFSVDSSSYTNGINSIQHSAPSLSQPELSAQRPKLLLTRVLPTNRTHNAGGQSVTPVPASIPTVPSSTLAPTTPKAPTASTVTDVSADATTASTGTKGDYGFAIPELPPSTTPKQPPKTDYYHFLRRAAATDESSADESSDVDHGVDSSRRHKGSSFMEYARKSLMQHPTASPRAAIRKISKVAAESHGRPTLTDLLSASDAEDVIDSRQQQQQRQQKQQQQQQPTMEMTQQSFAKPDTPFTFESTFLPPLNLTTKENSQLPNVRPSIVPTASRSDVAPDIVSPTSSGDGSHDEGAESTKDEQSNGQFANDLQHLGDANTTVLDLRTERTEGLTQDRDALSHAESLSVLRPSIARRTAPYKVPTVNERETLRSNRLPGYRARPLDPKVFTSAGDLGVPRIPKAPLTVPISPAFSKPRVKDYSRGSGIVPIQPTFSSRLETAVKSNQSARIPTNRLQTALTGGNQTRGGSAVSTTARRTVLSVPDVNQVRPRPNDTVPSSSDELATEPLSTADTTTTTTTNRPGIGGRFKALFAKPVGNTVPNATRGALVREEVPTSATTTDQSSDDQTAPKFAHHQARRPLTKPVPFRFATDEVLRKRHNMFQSRRSPPRTAAAERPKDTRPTENANNFKRQQPPLKRMTVPVPFLLATQRRAEVYAHLHNNSNHKDGETQPPPTTMVARRRSRLAGLAPLRSSLPPGATATGARKLPFRPTVPISPKLGRHAPVRALQPTRFLLKKSTKELTQPHEFHFHSDQRARERVTLERSAKQREQELEQLRQRTTKFNMERDQRLQVRESLERTFRAQPIKHYQSTNIHKAKKSLTRPVSPMIGEKRKRHEMEMQYLAQQQHQELQALEESASQANPFQVLAPVARQDAHILPGLIADIGRDLYREFEEAKILQERHRTLQEQLTRQERRQLELANSSHATIHQPPIRLSFPFNPDMEALQQTDKPALLSRSTYAAPSLIAHPDTLQELPNFTPALPAVKDSFGGSNYHRLSRDLRRISLNGRRSSGGVAGSRRRVSDTGSKSSGSGSGSGGRPSLEGKKTDVDNNAGGYYPFTRSQAPTGTLEPSQPAAGRSTNREAAGDNEDRRRSGSFIPLDMTEAPRPALNRSKGPLVIDHTLTLSDL